MMYSMWAFVLTYRVSKFDHCVYYGRIVALHPDSRTPRPKGAISERDAGAGTALEEKNTGSDIDICRSLWLATHFQKVNQQPILNFFRNVRMSFGLRG
jgi:hypothetical protein